MKQVVVCFDLDDTLYKEIGFVKSGFQAVADSIGKPEIVPLMMDWYKDGKNVFLHLNYYLNLEAPIADYLRIYRNHFPSIQLSNGVEDTLVVLKNRGVRLGLISDGRSVTQRNKIKALKLERWFEDKDIIISEEFGSEKNSEKNFCYFQELYPESCFSYVGDNPKKDFFIPNLLHWKTIMLKDNGCNIHQQCEVPECNLPQVIIYDIQELMDFIG